MNDGTRALLAGIGGIIVLIFIVAFGVKALSSVVKAENRNPKQYQEEAVTAVTLLNDGNEQVKTVKHDGHLFTMAVKYSGISVIHSPSCTCKNKE